jgi:hypothetical protein
MLKEKDFSIDRKESNVFVTKKNLAVNKISKTLLFCFYPLIWIMGVFLGINSSKTVSILGYNSFNLVRIFLWTEDLSWDWPAMFSEKLNLIYQIYLLVNIYKKKKKKNFSSFKMYLLLFKHVELSENKEIKKKWTMLCSFFIFQWKKYTKKTIKGSPRMTLPDAFLHAMMLYLLPNHVLENDLRKH